jgi:hypothetical protein
MTKKKNTGNAQSDPKTKLKWRLAKQPTLEDVLKLKESGLIKDEEAREMLFSIVDTDNEVKALKEQVEFLKDVIDRLSRQPAHVVYKYIETYTPRVTWVDTPYRQPAILCSSVGNLARGEVQSDKGNITYALGTQVYPATQVLTKTFGSGSTGSNTVTFTA